MKTRYLGNPRLFCLAALAVWCSAAFSFAQQNQDPLVGTWVSSGGSNAPITLVLNADGTGMMNTTQIRWSDNQGFSVTVGNNAPVGYSLNLNNDTMIISGGDLSQPLTFTRQGGHAQPAQAPTALGGALGSTGGAPPSNNGGWGTTPPQQQGDANHPANMFGAWVLQTSNGNMFLVLNTDGTGQIGNSPLRWEVQNGTLVLQFSNGKQSQFPVTVYGDTMQLSAQSDQGQPMQLVFHRTQMPNNASDNQQPQPQPNQQPQPQPQAQNTGYDDTAAFVGQWTSANGQVTIIFYPNGTTHFGSDTLFNYKAINGTLTITSQTNTGDNTVIAYRLNGDTLYLVINNQNLTFNRSGAAPAQGANPLGATPPPAAQPAPAAPAIDPAVVGTWQATDGTVVTLNADGSFLWNGQQMRFTAANGMIVITTPNGQMQWQYQANGDTLQVKYQNTVDTLHRVNPGTQQPAAQPSQVPPQGAKGW